MDYRNLSPMQLDALKEVFNIGSANAATSLSLLLNRKIDMGVPNIKIIRLEEILDDDLNNEVIAVLVKIVGEASGYILHAFDKHVAEEIIKALIPNGDVFNDMGMSTIAEIGNIIVSIFIRNSSSFILNSSFITHNSSLKKRCQKASLFTKRLLLRLLLVVQLVSFLKELQEGKQCCLLVLR